MMKKKIFLLLPLICCGLSALSQVSFKVDGFSDKYYGKVYISDTSEVTSPGSVTIYDKKSNKELFGVDADALLCDLHDGKLVANISERPYGEFSTILYEDYNFDGKKDFALMNGQNSCYNGPSFSIYLATDKGFCYSPEFSSLAEDYCGMFGVDAEHRTLHTMVKDGCCWHEFTTFIVENNLPKAVEICEYDQRDRPFEKYTEQKWDGKEMKKTTELTIDLEEEGLRKVLSFHVDKGNKDIILFSLNDGTLYYTVLKADNTVEFYYPLETEYQAPDFTYHPNEMALSFKNKDAAYKIYDDRQRIDIEITTGGKKYIWHGNIKSRKGSLEKLLKPRLDNVAIK